MPKLTKRTADSAKARAQDYFIWDDELPGLGLRVYMSGKRSYVLQYRFADRCRQLTIGRHGFWTPQLARKEARVLFGKIARGEDPSEQRQLNHKAMMVKELCELYLEDLNAGLIMGKAGRPKKPTTVISDVGRIHRHIIPLVGTRRVKDLTKADINKVLKDVMAGKTNCSFKTGKLRGKSIVRGGAGAASRTVGLLSGILTFAVEAGIIETNPAHGVRRPRDNVRSRRLSDAEYRMLGSILRAASKHDKYRMTVEIIRQLALTGCRRSEIVALRWEEVDFESSCLRLADSKEGSSIRPIGLPVVEYLDERGTKISKTYVFPGGGEENSFGSFPNHWEKIFRNTALGDVTPHVLRHSFASVANDLGFTESTIAALVGHARASVTSKYIHTPDAALIMAADTISGYIEGLLDGVEFKRTSYALDRGARKATLARFLKKMSSPPDDGLIAEEHLAA